MICAECDAQFEGNDYICSRCRHMNGTGRMIARYDTEGCNQWGTRYHSVCSQCEAEFPTNMLGMGTCMACGNRNNPMRDYTGRSD